MSAFVAEIQKETNLRPGRFFDMKLQSLVNYNLQRTSRFTAEKKLSCEFGWVQLVH